MVDATTYHLFAPLSNATGNFQVVDIGPPFRIERWRREKLLKMWWSVADLSETSIEFRTDIRSCAPRGAKVGHVVTASVSLSSTGEKKDVMVDHERLDEMSARLRQKLRLVSLFMNAHIDVADVYWYEIRDGKTEPFSETSPQYPVREMASHLSDARAADLTAFIADYSLPFKHDYIQLAFEHWEQALETSTPHIEFLSLVMSLEALFNVGQHDIRYRVSRSAAVLLGGDEDEAECIFKNVREAYDTRSKLVHTGKAENISSSDICQLRLLVRESIVTLLKLDQKKQDVADSLTRLGFGDAKKLNRKKR